LKKAFSILITGLPASGKTAIAKHLESILTKKSLKVEVLDGDEIRESLSSDLGFTREDRITHSKRIAYIAKVLNKNEVIVLISIIAPFKEMRNILQSEIVDLVEVFLKCPLKVCEQRDTKSNYAKARSGEIPNFTGVSSEYEEPENPDFICNTEENSPRKCAELILNKLISLNLIQPDSIYTPEEEKQIENQLKDLGYF
jgi:adenylylsulfate kinase